MDRDIIVGRVYRHFKGKEYKVICIANDSEIENEDGPRQLVVYEALYGKHLIWVRPYDLFASKVDKEKYPESLQEYRFELLNNND